MSTRWVDSHCHLQERFLHEGDQEEARASLERAAQAGLDAVVCVGTDEATSRQAVELANAVASGQMGAVPAVRAVVGLHPHEATESLEWLEPILAASDPLVVGVGECGLDYFYENSPKAEQRERFAQQIELAKRYDLALVIHARDAWDDLFDVLSDVGVPTETVLHCFTGGPNEAERCVEMGLTVSISGIVTFKNASEIRQAVVKVPTHRLLVETDSPFLAPVPHRGQPNEPSMVPLVGRAVAEALELEEAEIARLTSENARRIFRI